MFRSFFSTSFIPVLAMHRKCSVIYQGVVCHAVDSCCFQSIHCFKFILTLFFRDEPIFRSMDVMLRKKRTDSEMFPEIIFKSFGFLVTNWHTRSFLREDLPFARS